LKPYKIFTLALLLLLIKHGSYEKFCQGYWESNINTWTELEVISFNGENILFNLKIITEGNKKNESINIRADPSKTSGGNGDGISTTVEIEVWRDISNVKYSSGENITVYTYDYSYNHTYYEAKPKIFGLIVYPKDTHTLKLYLLPSFNSTFDNKPLTCKLPSSNYEGIYRVKPSPTNVFPYRHELTLEIFHSKSFQTHVNYLFTSVFFLYPLNIFLTAIYIFLWFRNTNTQIVDNLIRVSSAIIFFAPAFELAFTNLKAPLPIVFQDMMLFFLIPWNVLLIIFGIIIKAKNNS
jgi:hypothetical protein